MLGLCLVASLCPVSQWYYPPPSPRPPPLGAYWDHSPPPPPPPRLPLPGQAASSLRTVSIPSASAFAFDPATGAVAALTGSSLQVYLPSHFDAPSSTAVPQNQSTVIGPVSVPGTQLSIAFKRVVGAAWFLVLSTTSRQLMAFNTTTLALEFSVPLSQSAWPYSSSHGTSLVVSTAEADPVAYCIYSLGTYRSGVTRVGLLTRDVSMVYWSGMPSYIRRIAISANGDWLYVVTSEEVSSFSLTQQEGSNPQAQRRFRQSYYGDSYLVPLPDSGGHAVALGNAMRTVDMMSSLRQLALPPLAFAERLPLFYAFGTDGLLYAYSANSFEGLGLLGQLPSTLVSSTVHQSDASLAYFNVYVFTDAERGRALVCYDNLVVIAPLDVLGPIEPFLRAKLNGAESVMAGEPAHLEVAVADPRIQLRLMDEAPAGMLLNGTRLSWVPSLNDVGTAQINLTLSYNSVQRAVTFEVVVRFPSVLLPTKADAENEQVRKLVVDAEAQHAVVEAAQSSYYSSSSEIPSTHLVLLDIQQRRVVCERRLHYAIQALHINKYGVFVVPSQSILVRMLSLTDLADVKLSYITQGAASRLGDTFDGRLYVGSAVYNPQTLERESGSFDPSPDAIIDANMTSYVFFWSPSTRRALPHLPLSRALPRPTLWNRQVSTSGLSQQLSTGSGSTQLVHFAYSSSMSSTRTFAHMLRQLPAAVVLRAFSYNSHTVIKLELRDLLQGRVKKEMLLRNSTYVRADQYAYFLMDERDEQLIVGYSDEVFDIKLPHPDELDLPEPLQLLPRIVPSSVRSDETAIIQLQLSGAPDGSTSVELMYELPGLLLDRDGLAVTANGSQLFEYLVHLTASGPGGYSNGHHDAYSYDYGYDDGRQDYYGTIASTIDELNVAQFEEAEWNQMRRRAQRQYERMLPSASSIEGALPIAVPLMLMATGTDGQRAYLPATLLLVVTATDVARLLRIFAENSPAHPPPLPPQMPPAPPSLPASPTPPNEEYALIADLEQEVSRNSADRVATNARVADLEQEVGRNSADRVVSNSRVGQLSGQLTNLGRDVSRTSAEQAAVRDRVSDLRGQVSELARDVTYQAAEESKVDPLVFGIGLTAIILAIAACATAVASISMSFAVSKKRDEILDSLLLERKVVDAPLDKDEDDHQRTTTSITSSTVSLQLES